MSEILWILEVLAITLIFIPSILLLMLHSIMYHGSRKYRKPETPHNAKCGKISVIIPVRGEPLEYLEEALMHISEWGYEDLEVIIVSDDPYEEYKSIRDIVEKWRKKGLEVYVIWRSEPRGFKTGALNTALWFSNGKYFLTLDVDSRIDRGFIEAACSIIEKEEDVVAVCGRWYGKNRDTRIAEAVSASMDFVVKALFKGRQARGFPVLPVGSGTLYDSEFLKKVLRGWDEERIQDDLEIGCRIIGLGKKTYYLDEYRVMVEVPRRFKSLRVQQGRWAEGSLDVLLSRFRDIVKSKQSLLAKLDLIAYLIQYLPAVTVFIGFLLLVIISLLSNSDILAKYWYLGVIWFIVAIVYINYFVGALREEGYTFWKALVNLGRSATISIALSPIFTISCFKTLLCRRRVYHRTPKGRFEYTSQRRRFPLETVIGLLALSCSIYLITHNQLYTGGWFLAYSLGYIYSTLRWWTDMVFE
ncbi:MAG: glycosyltransferase family 2 protein [Thermoprotei archaeon]